MGFLQFLWIKSLVADGSNGPSPFSLPLHKIALESPRIFWKRRVLIYSATFPYGKVAFYLIFLHMGRHISRIRARRNTFIKIAPIYFSFSFDMPERTVLRGGGEGGVKTQKYFLSFFMSFNVPSLVTATVCLVLQHAAKDLVRGV